MVLSDGEKFGVRGKLGNIAIQLSTKFGEEARNEIDEIENIMKYLNKREK